DLLLPPGLRRRRSCRRGSPLASGRGSCTGRGDRRQPGGRGLHHSRGLCAGGSQGGGISIAVAGLVPDVAGVMTDVPFLADFRRAITITDEDPYTEIARYLKAHRDHTDRVLETLSYFDVAILGRRASAPALFSVGLMDEVCPPSTVYGAFNEYA